MKFSTRLHKDHLAAVLLLLLGLAVTIAGQRYQMGTLTRMGAGYIPVVLGVLLMVVGALIGLMAPAAARRTITAPSFEWRGWPCVLAGVLAFIVLGRYCGLLPATFGSVFISALGDRNNSVRTAFRLACLMVVIGFLIFSWALRLQFPLFIWGN